MLSTISLSLFAQKISFYINCQFVQFILDGGHEQIVFSSTSSMEIGDGVVLQWGGEGTVGSKVWGYGELGM